MSEAKQGDGGAGIGAKELSQGAKALNESKAARAADALDYDEQVANAMSSMYKEFDGDIDKLFERLDENPYKAKKYPPTDAEEFGRKYAQGFYEYIGAEGKA